MTEAEWLAATDPYAMLELRLGKVSDRKLRLFAVVCCQRALHFAATPHSHTRLSLAEQFADGLANEGQRAEAEGAHGGENDVATWALMRDAFRAACASQHFSVRNVLYHSKGNRKVRVATSENERGVQSALLRDILGNPFRIVTFDPNWRTSTAVALSQGIYEERAFDRMPILADALQDGGCENADTLDHCRGSGPHARGCWVIDRVLGKK